VTHAPGPDIDFAEAVLGLRPGMRVLDLACGWGRTTLELRRRGYTVTGFDISPDLIGLAREYALAEELDSHRKTRLAAHKQLTGRYLSALGVRASSLSGSYAYFFLEALMRLNASAGLVDTYQLEPTVGFITLMLGIFAVMFQLPILMAILASVGIVNAKMLADKWRHATLGIFIAAGIAAPDGNPLTMALLALPLLALYLASIVVVRFAQPKIARAS